MPCPSFAFPYFATAPVPRALGLDWTDAMREWQGGDSVCTKLSKAQRMKPLEMIGWVVWTTAV
jgi:hypothetical protein